MKHRLVTIYVIGQLLAPWPVILLFTANWHDLCINGVMICFTRGNNVFLHSSTFFSIMKHDVQKFENYRLLQTKRGIAMINSSLSSLYEANRNEFGERERERERDYTSRVRTIVMKLYEPVKWPKISATGVFLPVEIWFYRVISFPLCSLRADIIKSITQPLTSG